MRSVILYVCSYSIKFKGVCKEIMKKRLNFAVIGCSGMARLHMLGVLNNDANLYAICDVAQSQIDERLKEFKVERTCNDYRELVSDPNVDVAILVTPDYYHLEMTEAFLRAGKHVLCEKPMALTMEECERMIQVSKECDKLLMVGQVCRCNPVFIKAKQLIDKGFIGELFFVESEYAHDYGVSRGFNDWRVDPRRHGFIGGGCHAVDMLRWIVGDPTKVYALGNKKCLTDWPIQDDANVALYTFPNDVMGKVFVSIGCKRNYTMRSCFYGTEGTIVCDTNPGRGEVTIYREDKENPLPFHGGMGPGYKDYNVGHTISVGVKDHNVEGEIKQLIEAIENGTELPISPKDAAGSVAACCAAIESAKTGMPVDIKYPNV